MNTKNARQLGGQLKEWIVAGETTRAFSELKPVINEKIPFRIVGLIGDGLGDLDHSRLFPFLDLLAETHTQGGWVIIGTALNRVYPQDPSQVLRQCAGYIVLGDVWYATDILGERVPGPALVTDFRRTLSHLETWRDSANPWVRRSIGVAAHFWAKRSRGEAALAARAAKLLTLLEPMFEDQEIEAVKGVGWGLKTLGRMYPEQMTSWLQSQSGRPHRAIMLRKALTYLTTDQKAKILAS